MRMGPHQAEAMVTAYLGRPPQDEMEAAVVLESWGGVSSRHALPTAARMEFRPAPSGLVGSNRVGLEGTTPPTDSASLVESLSTFAFIMALFSLAVVGASLGPGVATDAWRPAVPVSLGVTWFFRRRYGFGSAALALLRQDSAVILGVTLAGAAATMLLATVDGMVLSFVLLAVGGALAVLRGWGLVAAVLVVLIAVGSLAGHWSTTAMFSVADVTVVGVAVVAVVTSGRPRGRVRSWRRAVSAGGSGVAVGLLIVLMTSGADGVAPYVVALALVPSLIASIICGVRLARFWLVVPSALARQPVLADEAEPGRVARALATGAVVWALVVLVVLSGAAHVVAAVNGSAAGTDVLLVGFGAAALVGLAVTFLEAFARSGWAVGTAVVACACYLGATAAGLSQSSADLVGAGLALAVSAAPVVSLLRRPEVTVATLI